MFQPLTEKLSFYLIQYFPCITNCVMSMCNLVELVTVYFKKHMCVCKNDAISQSIMVETRSVASILGKGGLNSHAQLQCVHDRRLTVTGILTEKHKKLPI